ncbi:MAG: hypothetical protein ACREED_03495, partial [Stellaceae bacterium]
DRTHRRVAELGMENEMSDQAADKEHVEHERHDKRDDDAAPPFRGAVNDLGGAHIAVSSVEKKLVG